MADHDDCLELPTLFLPVEHPDEEEPQLPACHPLEITVEQVFSMGQPVILHKFSSDTICCSLLEWLEPRIGGVVTTSAEYNYN